MPFRKKGSPNWHYDIQVNGCRYCGSTGTANYEEAKSYEAEVRRQAKVKRPDKTSYTIREALGTYWAEVSKGQTCSKVTLSQSKMLIDNLDAKKPTHKLTQNDLKEFSIRRRATASNATVNRQLQLLGRAVRHMAEHHGAGMPKVDFRKAENNEPQERIRELTIGEQRRLFDNLRPDLVPFVTFALMTGARKATIQNLMWSDVDLEGRRMIFRTKGKKQMTFQINNQLRALLISQPKSNVFSYKPYVFTLLHQKTGERQRVRANTFDGIWRKAVRDAGILDFRFHDLRHTFATRMLRRTGNLKLVSKLLGHSEVATTSRYAHVLEEDLWSALADFDPLEMNESRKNSRRSS